jgi:hypothetical protein
MSSNPPPTYVVPIYNPAYFASSTEGLTIGEASGIFLNKTSPDIATALETFNAGINTNNITPTTTASTLSLNSSKTGSTNADPCIAIATSTGITRTIKIGAEGGTNPNSVHLAGLDVTNTSLNNITGTTGVINVGNLQTNGILNLGTGTIRTLTGSINIANTNGCLCPVNILNGGATTAGSFNLANTGANSTVVNIGSASSTGNFNLNTCGTINIGTDNTTVANTINIGATNTVISQVFCRATFTVSRAFLCSALFTVNGNAVFGSTITLQGSTTPTQDTMLGGTRSGTIITTAVTTGTVYSSVALTQAGTYLFTFQIYQPVTTIGVTNYIKLSGTGTTDTNFGWNNTVYPTQISFGGSAVVTCTASTYSLTVTTDSTYALGQGGYFKATRIG